MTTLIKFTIDSKAQVSQPNIHTLIENFINYHFGFTGKNCRQGYCPEKLENWCL